MSRTRTIEAGELARYAPESRADRSAGWNKLRAQAWEQFEAVGFPSSKAEAWRFTQPKALAPQGVPGWQLPPVGNLTAHEVDEYQLWDPEALRIVFVDGRYAPELSQLTAAPERTEVCHFGDAFERQDPALDALGTVAAIESHSFVALNTAAHQDGVLVHIGSGVQVEHPIHVLHLATRRAEPFQQFPRNLIVLEQGSRASVVETYVGPGAAEYGTLAVTEAVIGANAVLEHYKDTEEGPEAAHLGIVRARLSRDARFVSHAYSFGGRTTRTEIGIEFAGEGGEAVMQGLYVVDGDRHVDHQTFVDHAVPHCRSDEEYRGILDGGARAVFNGEVLVREGAQQSEAHQQNKNLLLSDRARVDAKPQLEIYADDVRCTHGATIGQLDEDSVFYLRSRGIPERAARTMLTRGFASAITETITIPAVRCRIDQLLYHRLEEEQQS